jgi:hypothetical protein
MKHGGAIALRAEEYFVFGRVAKTVVIPGRG